MMQRYKTQSLRSRLKDKALGFLFVCVYGAALAVLMFDIFFWRL